MPSRTKRILINIFIVFNVLAVVLGSPKSYEPLPVFRDFFYPYLWWIRLEQAWILFAPDVRQIASKYEFVIEFKDLTRKTWSRPYPEQWDFFQRHLAYNFQKHDLANTYLERIPPVRKDYCAFVLRMFWQDENPPIAIQLVRHSAQWPAPVADQPLNYDETSLKWERYILARFEVNPETKELF